MVWQSVKQFCTILKCFWDCYHTKSCPNHLLRSLFQDVQSFIHHRLFKICQAPDRPLQHLRLAAPRSFAPGWTPRPNCWRNPANHLMHLIWRICHLCKGFIYRIYHLSQMVQMFFQPHQLQHPILVRFFATRNQQPILFLDFINLCLHPPLFCCSKCKWTTVQRGGLGSVVIIVCTPSVTKDSLKRLTKVSQIWRSLHFTWS